MPLPRTISGGGGITAAFVALISLSVLASAPATVQRQICSSFRNLQVLDWPSVDVDKAASTLEAKLEPESLELAETCQGTILYAATLPETRIVMEFEQERINQKCVRRLTHATAVLHVTNNEAHVLETEVRQAVKAGGRVCVTDGTDVYEWRSADSRRRYLLHTDITAESAANLSPVTPSRLRISLEHFAADPLEVDDLPFERGFKPSCP